MFVPRRPSTRQKGSLTAMERLSHLEDVIGHMRKDLEVKTSQLMTEKCMVSGQSTQEMTNDSTEPDPTSDRQNSVDKVVELDAEFGKLAIGDGRSRYITSNFWASLNEEVCSSKIHPSMQLRQYPDSFLI